MVSGDVRCIAIGMKNIDLNIIVYSYSEGSAERSGMHFIINRTIMRLQN